MDFIQGWFAYAVMNLPNTGVIFTVLFFILILLFAYRVMNNESNTLDWWQLLGSKGDDGKQYADWNKIGQGFGVMIAVWMPFIYVHSDKMDAVGLALVMGASLTYLGAVSAYSKFIKSKQGDKT